MSKKALLVAYPLLPVSEASAGGAEQILWTLERELAGRGWRTSVAACAGSKIAGELIVTGGGRERESQSQNQQPQVSQKRANLGHPQPQHPQDSGHTEGGRVLDDFEAREREHAERVVAACRDDKFDLVLDHSGHFFRHAGRVEAMVLATLHLPRELYAAGAFDRVAENVCFNCVSDSQRSTFMDIQRVLGVVRNGIALERFQVGGRKTDGLLWLGRICPEKAPHLAIEAAQRAGLPIVLAGQVYPFQWHMDYWEREVKPRIDGDRVRWVPLPSFEEKSKLLREARALLVTSQVAETTSLVALEAMASGTPVIAFKIGALEEVVPKCAGILVQSVEEMAEACGAVEGIRTEACREWVEREYSAKAMADGYEELMGRLGKSSAG